MEFKMGSYAGTDGRDTITPYTLSGGVTADPTGSKPSDADDIINGLGENDTIGGGGGANVINGGAGDDAIGTVAVAAGMASSGNVIHGNGGKDSIDVAIRDTDGVNPATNTAWGDDGDNTVALTYYATMDHYSWAGQGPTGTIALHGGAGNDTVGVYGSVDTFGFTATATTGSLPCSATTRSMAGSEMTSLPARPGTTRSSPAKATTGSAAEPATTGSMAKVAVTS